jgi:hypothetical protein
VVVVLLVVVVVVVVVMVNEKCDYLSVICIKKNLEEERKLVPVNKSEFQNAKSHK